MKTFKLMIAMGFMGVLLTGCAAEIGTGYDYNSAAYCGCRNTVSWNGCADYRSCSTGYHYRCCR